MPRSPVHTSLEAELLVLLRQACREREYRVADHLLSALTCLDKKTDDHFYGEASWVDKGLLVIATELRPEPSGGP